MRPLLNTLYITNENAYLHLENNNIVVSEGDTKLTSLPLMNIERIIYFGYKGASPYLLGYCSENGIDFTFFSPHGRFLARINKDNSGNVLLRHEQYRIYDQPQIALKYAKNFITGKIYNCKWVIERFIRENPMHEKIDELKKKSLALSQYMKDTQAAKDSMQLLGIEGAAAREYFSVFNYLIKSKDPSFNFIERNRRPPLDRTNALLSFAYSLLANQCAAALESVGLDPYVGFFHRERPGRISLSLDLMEELRPVIADRCVLALINLGVFHDSDFTTQESGAVLLSDSGRKTFLSYWQKRQNTEITHPFSNECIKWGLVPYLQSLLLARTIRKDLPEYPPFFWK